MENKANKYIVGQEIQNSKDFTNKLKSKKAYDYALVAEFSQKVKTKMNFALEVEGVNGRQLTQDEKDAITFGFNSAINKCGEAINIVLKEYSNKE